MSKRLTLALKVIATILLLSLALKSAGLFDRGGRQALLQLVVGADRTFLAISIGFIFFMDALSTAKWRALVIARNMHASFLRLLGYYIVGRFYNLVLPSSIGGDVIRIHLLGKSTGRNADSAAIIFVERYTGVITLILLTAVAIGFAGVEGSNVTLLPLVGTALTGSIVLLWILTDQRFASFLGTLSNIRVIGKIAAIISKLRAALLEFRSERKALGMTMLYSLAFYAAAVVNVWVTVMVFKVDVSFYDLAIAVPIIMFIMNIPISIGNYGIMEFGYTFMLMQVGISGEAAVATALLMRLKLLLGGGVGACLYLLIKDSHLSDDEKKALSS